MSTVVEQKEKVFSVSEYLAVLNAGLRRYKAKIIGEVSGMNPSRSGHVYFDLKDDTGTCLLHCMIYKDKYNIYGLDLKDGLKIVAYGYPNIHPQYSFSFITETIELAGEGALKKEYERLKNKLTEEGFFEPSRKRRLPLFPNKIGLITSRKGDVLGDFLTNIGKFGFKIKMIDSRVDGQIAAPDLISSIRTFKKQDIDVLVIMRGGGSLESFIAFNNEILVREVVAFPVPVIVAVGHNKDMPLIALAADLNVSTPSIAATTLGESWREAGRFLDKQERGILGRFEKVLYNANLMINETMNKVKDERNKIFDRCRNVENELRFSLQKFSGAIADHRSSIENLFNKSLFGFNSLLSIAKTQEKFSAQFSVLRSALFGIKKKLQNSLSNYVGVLDHNLSSTKRELLRIEENIKNGNPEKQLNLGYSIATINGKLVRRIEEIKAGQNMDVKIKEGVILSEVKNIKKNN